MPFQPVHAESLSVQVFESIRDAIFRGELKPGETLRELGLAKILNVSQATVREALVHLEQYGLVVRVPNHQTTVAKIAEGGKDLKAGVLALGVIAYNGLPENIEDLLKNVQTAQTGDTMPAFQLHVAILSQASNKAAGKAVELMIPPLFAFKLVDFSPPSCAKLVSALQSGNAMVIRAALEDIFVTAEVKEAGEEKSGGDSEKMYATA